jgi:hypothetical protein
MSTNHKDRVLATGRSRLRQSKMLIIATGLLALTATAIPAQAVASALPPAPRPGSLPKVLSQSCPDVEFMGARGSGEKSITPFRGVGPEVNQMFNVIQGMLHKKGITYGTDEIMPYPADSINVLKPSIYELMLFLADRSAGAHYYYDHNLKKFLASISQGVTHAIGTIKDFHDLCTHTVYVLGGYSQGAMVIHQAENRLPAALRKTISGTLLVGDGNRVVDTKAKEFGTSPAAAQGISTYLRKYIKSLGSVRDVPLPKTTANICNNHDYVCDFNLYAIQHFPSSSKIHSSYAKCNSKNKCTYEKILTTAAEWVGNIVIKRLIG